MKWRLISNEHATLQEYHLMSNDNCEVIMKYNAKHQSVRLTSGTHQRLFFIEIVGQLHPKTIFKNEYSMETGNISLDKLSKDAGIITIDLTKHHFRILSSLPSLMIFERGAEQPVISCNLIPSGSESINNNWLILGLCWYLDLPGTKEKLANMLTLQTTHY